MTTLFTLLTACGFTNPIACCTTNPLSPKAQFPKMEKTIFPPLGYQLIHIRVQQPPPWGVTIEYLHERQSWQDDVSMQGILSQIDSTSETPWCQVTSVEVSCYGSMIGLQVGDLFVEPDMDTHQLLLTELDRFKQLQDSMPHWVPGFCLLRKIPSLPPSPPPDDIVAAQSSPSLQVAHSPAPIAATVAQLETAISAHRYNSYFAIPAPLQVVPIQITDNGALLVDLGTGSPWSYPKYSSNTDFQISIGTHANQSTPSWCEVIQLDKTGYGHRCGLRQFDLFVKKQGLLIRYLDQNEVMQILSCCPTTCHVLRSVEQDTNVEDDGLEASDSIQSLGGSLNTQDEGTNMYPAGLSSLSVVQQTEFGEQGPGPVLTATVDEPPNDSPVQLTGNVWVKIGQSSHIAKIVSAPNENDYLVKWGITGKKEKVPRDSCIAVSSITRDRKRNSPNRFSDQNFDSPKKRRINKQSTEMPSAGISVFEAEIFYGDQLSTKCYGEDDNRDGTDGGSQDVPGSVGAAVAATQGSHKSGHEASSTDVDPPSTDARQKMIPMSISTPNLGVPIAAVGADLPIASYHTAADAHNWLPDDDREWQVWQTENGRALPDIASPPLTPVTSVTLPKKAPSVMATAIGRQTITKQPKQRVTAPSFFDGSTTFAKLDYSFPSGTAIQGQNNQSQQLTSDDGTIERRTTDQAGISNSAKTAPHSANAAIVQQGQKDNRNQATSPMPFSDTHDEMVANNETSPLISSEVVNSIIQQIDETARTSHTMVDVDTSTYTVLELVAIGAHIIGAFRNLPLAEFNTLVDNHYNRIDREIEKAQMFFGHAQAARFLNVSNFLVLDDDASPSQLVTCNIAIGNTNYTTVPGRLLIKANQTKPVTANELRSVNAQLRGKTMVIMVSVISTFLGFPQTNYNYMNGALLLGGYQQSPSGSNRLTKRDWGSSPPLQLREKPSPMESIFARAYIAIDQYKKSLANSSPSRSKGGRFSKDHWIAWRTVDYSDTFPLLQHLRNP